MSLKLADRFATRWLDAFLLNSADSIIARLSVAAGGVAVDLPPAAKAVLRHNGQDKFYFQILDTKGNRLTGDAFLPLPRNVQFKGPTFRTVVVQGHTVRLCRVPANIGGDEVFVQVAETLTSRNQLINQIFLSLVGAQFALVLLAGICVWWGITISLDPLSRLGHLLQSREQFNLSPIDLADRPSELLPVLDELNKLLAATSKQLEFQKKFVADAAHQLRTPVTALRTYLDHLRRLNRAPAEGLLDKLSLVTNRIAYMINRLLILARAELSGGRTMRPVDITQSIDAAASALVHSAIAKNIELYFDVPSEPVIVMSDPDDMVELVTNLLDNAIKYTLANGSVWLTLKAGEPVVLTVEDSGPGIPDDQKERVFERFYRQLGTEGIGTGLGLSIVAEIVHALGGEIKLSDSHHGGACFAVLLPAAGSAQNRLDTVGQENAS